MDGRETRKTGSDAGKRMFSLCFVTLFTVLFRVSVASKTVGTREEPLFSSGPSERSPGRLGSPRPSILSRKRDRGSRNLRRVYSVRRYCRRVSRRTRVGNPQRFTFGKRRDSHAARHRAQTLLDSERSEELVFLRWFSARSFRSFKTVFLDLIRAGRTDR